MKEYVLKEMVHERSTRKESLTLRILPDSVKREDRDPIPLSRIHILDSGDMMIVPGERGKDSTSSATIIATLMHKYNITTIPDFKRDYGCEVTVKAGQLPEALGVLKRYGLSADIARAIARDQGEALASPRLLKMLSGSDVNRIGRNGSHTNGNGNRTNGNGHYR